MQAMSLSPILSFSLKWFCDYLTKYVHEHHKFILIIMGEYLYLFSLILFVIQ